MAVKTWDKKPVFNDHEAWLRLRLEKREIEAHFSPEKIKMILNLSADVTGEVHAFPIFTSDTRTDLVNRYIDLFPAESKLAVEQVKQMNNALYDHRGFSKERLVMGKLQIPLTLYMILSTYAPDFWTHITAKRIKDLTSDFAQLKIGTGNGPTT